MTLPGRLSAVAVPWENQGASLANQPIIGLLAYRDRAFLGGQVCDDASWQVIHVATVDDIKQDRPVYVVRHSNTNLIY